jgi:hypothetical protein
MMPGKMPQTQRMRLSMAVPGLPHMSTAIGGMRMANRYLMVSSGVLCLLRVASFAGRVAGYCYNGSGGLSSVAS